MKKITLACSATALLAINTAMADTQKNPFDINFDPDAFTTSASLGWLGGESKEFVYDTDQGGKKVSQLNWKFKNVNILKLDFSWDLLPWLTANARGWTALSKGNSHLDDYDWEVPGQANWSEKSSTPDTRLNYASEYDLNLKAWPLQWQGLKLGPVAGYQQTRFSWAGYGGSYSYQNGADVGELDAGKGITYKQKFSLPYVGIAGQFRHQKFEVNALIKYSQWVSAKDTDNHILRNVISNSDISNAKYYGVSMDVGYYLTPQFKLFTDLAWNKYENSKGGGHGFEEGNYVSTKEDAQGLGNTNYSASLGVQYHF